MGSSERIFQSSAHRIAELEALLDGPDPERTRQYVIDHPEIVRPDLIRSYSSMSVHGKIVELLLLLPGERSPEWLIFRVGHPNETLYTDPNTLSKAYLQTQTELLDLETRLRASKDPMMPLGFEISKATFLCVMGRTAKLSYGQRKTLFLENRESNHKVESFDDLPNRFRFYVNDITEIRDRFPSVESRMERLNINSDSDFDNIMRDIECEMQNEGVPITARSIEAWLRFSSAFRLSLTNSDPLSQKIFNWFTRRSGDCAKI
jgi:hypothetical protein